MIRILLSELARYFWSDIKHGLSKTRLNPMAHVARGRPLIYGVRGARIVIPPGDYRARSILIQNCHMLSLEGSKREAS